MLSDNTAVVRLLAALTRGGKYRGNPYCSPEVEAVMRHIQLERNYNNALVIPPQPQIKDWQDALEGLAEYETYPATGD